MNTSRSEPAKESSDDDPAQKSPAQKFMESEDTDKKAILSNMASVMEMDSILPEKLSSWDKGTTTMVLEKALNLCGIPTSTNGETTVEEKQEALQLQIKALKEKMERNAALLEEHRKTREAINRGQESRGAIMMDLAERQLHLEYERRQRGENHPHVLAEQEIIDGLLRLSQEIQEHLDGLELPLRNE